MTMKIISRNLMGSTTAERAGSSLVLATILSGVGFTSIFSMLPLYMQQLSGSGAAAVLWAGFAMAATPLAGGMVSPLWGRLVARFGYRSMLMRSLVCTTVVTVLMTLPSAPWQLVLLRALAGALGSFQPAAMGAMTSWSRPEDLSKAISRLQMGQIFGAIVGPLLGGAVATIFGLRAVPLAGALALGLGIVLIGRWFYEPQSKRTQLRGADQPLRPLLLWLPMATLVAVQFTDASFNPILPVLLAQSEGDPTSVAAIVGFAASFNAVAAAVASGLAGQLCKRGVSRRSAAVATSILGVLAFGAMVAPLPWGMVALRISCGGLAAAMAVAAFSAGGLAVLPGQRGSAYGWLSSASMFGYAASPVVTGAVAAIDLRAVLPLDAALCLVAAAGWYRAPLSEALTPAKAAQGQTEPVATVSSPDPGSSQCRGTMDNPR